MILLLTAVVLIFMLLFPPFYFSNGTAKISKGYRFIFDPIKRAYWNKEAEIQTATSFEEYIKSDKGRASLSDQGFILNFDFIKDPRWATLDETKKTAVLDMAFADEVASDPRWKTLTPDLQADYRKTYFDEAFKAEQELKRVRDIYFDEEKKKYPKKIEAVPPLVDTFQLLAQAIIVILVGGILWFALKDEK